MNRSFRLRRIVLPGVFRPRSDTWLLARTAASMPLRHGAAILELCAGPALAGIAAAEAHGGTLTTVDVSVRAALNARLNGLLNGVKVQALYGDVFKVVGDQRFDLILANPPYVPGPPPPTLATPPYVRGPPPPPRGTARATDAGADGRAILDRICADAPAHLTPGGVLL